MKKYTKSPTPPTPQYPTRKPPPLFSSDWWNELALQYRFLFVIPILLPASTIYTLYWSFRSWLVSRTPSSVRTSSHDEKVRGIQRQIKAWRASGSKNLLCTARPTFLSVGLRNQNYKRKDNQIQLDLHDIVEFDQEALTVTLEPGVNVGQLTRFLNPLGYTIAVVPELDDLTFGGLINGYGIESSSHKWGLLSDLLVQCQVVLGDASVVTCSPTENEDLFRAIPWSHGSLGLLTLLTLKVIFSNPGHSLRKVGEAGLRARHHSRWHVRSLFHARQRA